MTWYWFAIISVGFLVVSGLLAAIAIQLRQELEDRKSEQARLQALWDHFPGVVTEIRGDGTIMSLGSGSQSVSGDRNVNGSNIRDHLEGESYEAFSQALSRAVDTGHSQTYDVIVEVADGSERRFGNRLLPVRRDGQLSSFLIVSLDRTELHKVETELTRQRLIAEGSSAAKSRFLASVSHEIRNPLNSMLGMVTLLGATVLTPRQRHHLTTLQQAADHLMGIVNDVLDLSRIEAGKLELADAEFDLPDLAQHVASMMHHQASEKRLALQLFINDDVPVRVRGDALRVRQILMNLLSNAIKFTSQGHVILRLANSPTGIRLTVEDTGMGIDSERARNLFEEYSTLHGQVSREQGGNGLGLNICKRLTEAMGGFIGVLSTPDVGSCFWVDLPLNPSGSVLFRDAMPQEYHQRTLWIADSFAVNRTLVVAVARRLGMSVRGFDRLRDVLAALEGDSPDILIISRRFFLAPDTQAQINSLKQPDMKLGVSCDETFSEDWRPPAEVVHESWSWPLDQRELSQILGRMLDDESPEDVAAPDAPVAGTPETGLSVLIVEDDRVNIKIAEHFLRKLGCQVLSAVSGEEALALLNGETHVDLVIMDRHMPGIDGLETTRRIRVNPRWAELPVIALSADVMPEQQEEFLAAGASGYLTKPLRPEELRSLIGHYEALPREEHCHRE